MSFKSISPTLCRLLTNLKSVWVHFPPALLALAAITGHCAAQPSPTPYVKNVEPLPEVMIVPVKSEGKVLTGGGWILTFRNQLRGNDAPIREVEYRIVTYKTGDQTEVQNQIAWEIVRTPNMGCRTVHSDSCHDAIRVLSVPMGFMAVPEGGLVEEGGTLQVLIVPSAMF